MCLVRSRFCQRWAGAYGHPGFTVLPLGSLRPHATTWRVAKKRLFYH
jgi:hypothetical protein